MCRSRWCSPWPRTSTKRSKQQAEDLARELSEYTSAARATTEALLRNGGEDHPRPEELTATIERSLHRAYEMLAEGALLPLPTVRPTRVVEMRAVPLATSSSFPLHPAGPSGPLLRFDQVDVNWKDKWLIGEHLRMLDRSQIMVTVLRDVVPGRLALQLILRQKQATLSPVRLRRHSTYCGEGWPLYATQQAIEMLPKGEANDR